MCYVDLPCPPDQTSTRYRESAIEHHPRIDERGGVAGDENEQVGGIAEAVVALREPIDRVVRDVVEIDRPVRETTQNVEPIVAPFRRRDCSDLHVERSTASKLRLERGPIICLASWRRRQLAATPDRT